MTGTLQIASHLNDIEFNDGPDIVLDDDKAQSRSADKGDCRLAPISASKSKASEGKSSLHKVEDLGFEAAATNFSEHSRNSIDCDAAISDSLKTVFKTRKLHQSSRLRNQRGSARVQASLQEQVGKALTYSHFDDEQYLPLDSFEKIFNIESIAALLDEAYHLPTDRELQNKLASIVDRKSGRSRRRILGVLIFMSGVAHIDSFIREGIWDDQLPLERLPRRNTSCVRTRNSENCNLMKDWSRPDVDLFYLYQKMFFVPFFDIKENRLCSYELHSDIRLPWEVYEHKTSGGFGVVHKVEIHPSHHNFVRSNVGLPVITICPTVTEFHSPRVSQYSHSRPSKHGITKHTEKSSLHSRRHARRSRRRNT